MKIKAGCSARARTTPASPVSAAEMTCSLELQDITEQFEVGCSTMRICSPAMVTYDFAWWRASLTMFTNPAAETLPSGLTRYGL